MLNRRSHDCQSSASVAQFIALVAKALGKRAPGPIPSPRPEDHLIKLVAAIAIADPGLSLHDIAARDQMGERPVRGCKKW